MARTQMPDPSAAVPPPASLPQGKHAAREIRRGEATRNRLMAVAEASVLAKGFGATSIEEVIAEAGITKSGFFYHFRDKNELAREMLRRYIAADEVLFDDVFGRGRQQSDDPLQAYLISLDLLAKIMSDLPNGHPGCLIASICYQERLFDREVCDMNMRAVKGWNARFLGNVEEIAAVHPPRETVVLADVANMLSCIMEGGVVVSKATRSPDEIGRQILVYRRFIKVLFSAD